MKDADSFRWFRKTARLSKDPIRREALAKVERAVRGAGVTYPAADLLSLARYLEVQNVRVAPLATKARVTSTALGGTEVELNDGLNEHERRFTLAHELAHIIIGDRPPGYSYNQFEATCDACAREILLSEDFVIDTFAPPAATQDQLWRVCQLAGLPVDEVFQRAIEVGAIPKHDAFWCRARQGGFTVIRSYPAEYPERLAVLSLTEIAPFPITSALHHRQPTAGQVNRSDGDISYRRLDVICYPIDSSSVLVLLAT